MSAKREERGNGEGEGRDLLGGGSEVSMEGGSTGLISETVDMVASTATHQQI